jgi:hypothetical protein
MLKRSIVVAACAALLAFAGTAQAQENATLVLKSGERVSGQLVDLGGVGFTIRVNGEDRKIGKSDVAVIEFATADNTRATNEVNAQLSGGKHVVMLRSGEQIAGNLYDISGTSPLKITIDTPSGRRDVNSSEIGRIYLSAEGGAAVATSGGGTTASTPGPAGSISVPGNQQWVATGLTVRRGERIGFNVQGEIEFAPNDRAAAAGSLNQRRTPGAPLPNELAGALIGRIGNGQPFAIGNQASIPMPDSGPLYLGVNDDNLGDNSGQFNVTLTRAARRR